MKKLFFIMLWIPGLGICAPCDTADLLQKIRPGAAWTVRGQTIEWLDAVQVQPTAQELATAKTDCLATLTPTGILAGQRAAAINQLNIDPSGNAKVIRAVFLVALDEVNLLRQRDVDRSADVAAATTLADLKTRWAARTALADRTAAQFKNAVEAKINAGSAD